MASEKLEIILDTRNARATGCAWADDVFEMDPSANIAVQKIRFVDVSRLAKSNRPPATALPVRSLAEWCGNDST